VRLLVVRALVSLIVASVLVRLGTAVASERAPLPAASLKSTVARPHLDAPAIPQPGRIALPNPASSQLLWSHKELQVVPHLRLMIFAPHPDDETLAAGGLIQRVLEKKGVVRVVFVTNGDGYVDGVRKEVKRARTSTADFLHYGRRRHDEALHALRGLGLGKGDGLFLGFPDDGIDDLWAGHWSDRTPYTSPYTRSARPPYRDSLSQRVEYAGIDLEGELRRTLRDFRPDWVLMPDPRDRHPDHCTTGVFVLDALRKLRREAKSPFTRTEVLTYLVHYPDYPASPAWVKEIAGAGVGGSRAARRALSAVHWVNLPLTPTEQAGKRAALDAYQSQFEVMSPFLRQFLRPMELFGQLDAAQIMTVPYEYAARFGRSR
jgi:LmbE family N-acetylglucosaminyl deacetylase